jgi:hypothetical protein
MKLQSLAIAAALALFCAPAPLQAHFVLREPPSWLKENTVGDPQKLGPCGGTSADQGVPTGIITPVIGGGVLHVSIRPTVYHPGHFRIALSVLDRAELPPDPSDVTRQGPNGPISVSAAIERRPKPPVLVDGLWEQRQPAPDAEFATDIRLPNINCARCSLQVIQFMEQHAVNPDGRFTYHHCADLRITADPTLPIDTAWPGQGEFEGRAPR